MLQDMGYRMSLFAPIEFSQMRKTELGISLLDDRLYASRLRNVSGQLCSTFASYVLLWYGHVFVSVACMYQCS